MIETKSPLKPHTRHSAPLLIMIICGIALFTSYAVGSSLKQRTNTPANPKTLVPIEEVEHVERLAREPMVVELSDGTLFVSGYDGNLEKPPSLWRSKDHGATWDHVNVGSQADG